MNELFTITDDLVLIRDANGYCQQVLTPQSKLLYQPVDRVLGQSLHSNLPPAIAHNLFEAIQITLQQQQTLQREYSLEIRGREVWLDARLSPISENLVMFVIRDISDRKQLEAQLCESQSQLQTILDQASAAIVSFRYYPNDLRFDYLFYSAGCEQVYNYSANELLSNPNLWRSRVHPDDWQQVLLPAFANIQAGTTKIEYRFYDSTNTIRWIAETATMTWDEDRQGWSVITVAQDVSDRKTAEVQLQTLNNALNHRVQARTQELQTAQIALAQQERRLRNLLQTIPDLIAHFDRDFRYLYVNSALTAVTGIPAQAYIGKHICEMGHPKQLADLLIAKLQQTLALGQETITYFDYPTAQGTTYYQSKLVPEFNATGAVETVLVISRNITELKETELALRRNEEQFRTFFDATPLPLSLADVKTCQLVRVNDAYVDWLGYSYDELYSSTFLDFTYADDIESNRRLNEAMQSGDLAQIQARKRFVKKSGEVVWADIKVVLIRDAQANPLYSLCLAQDVTQAMQLIAARNRAEVALRRQAQRDQLLRSITQHIHQSLNLEEILAIAVSEVRRTVNADRALIFQLHPDGSGVVVKESVREAYPTTETDEWKQIKISPTCYNLFCEGRPRIVLDLAQDDCALRSVNYLQSVGVRSKMIAPIIQIREQDDKSLWGLLIVHACAEPRQWELEEAELLQQMANQLAIAIQQATLYQQVQIDLAKRQHTEANLRTLLQEKDVLLKEVHHRVKNNLQIISSLLRMQTRLVDPPIGELFQEAQNRVQAIAVIHEHLYQSANLAEINFTKYVQILVNNLLRSYGVNSQDIQVCLEIQPIPLGLNIAIPCGLIINELVSNSLKYAFSNSQKGEIKISLFSKSTTLTSSENKVILVVKDNGVGFPAELNWQTTRSLGLRIVCTLVEQIGGTIVMGREAGTTFQITVPITVPTSTIDD